mmetsp:Transcript_32794/g.64604  ORF Transcript_32794/g.64604 Transcript_32794/m.64604 type:complete len:210 (+) Transcript_32794:220-849(+)
MVRELSSKKMSVPFAHDIDRLHEQADFALLQTCDAVPTFNELDGVAYQGEQHPPTCSFARRRRTFKQHTAMGIGCVPGLPAVTQRVHRQHLALCVGQMRAQRHGKQLCCGSLQSIRHVFRSPRDPASHRFSCESACRNDPLLLHPPNGQGCKAHLVVRDCLEAQRPTNFFSIVRTQSTRSALISKIWCGMDSRLRCHEGLQSIRRCGNS